jgi:hypothetical protein
VSYKVLISEAVKRQIASWGLSRDLRLEVYQRLTTELARDPDGCLRGRIAPLMAFEYSFVLVDTKRLPHHHVCFFAVDRFDELRELHIVGCRHTTEETGEN